MKTAAKWGAILGVVVIVWTLILHMLGFYTTKIAAGQVADQVASVLPIIVIVLALRERRKLVGRGLRVVESLQTGAVLGLTSVPITAGFFWIYHHVINPEWMALIIAWKSAAMTARGATPEAITAATTQLSASSTDSAQILGALIGTLVFSVLIALIAGLFFRRPTVDVKT